MSVWPGLLLAFDNGLSLQLLPGPEELDDTLALWELFRLGKYPPPDIDPELWRMRPYILAVLLSYCVGMLSSTRSYSLPTYMLLSLAASYIALARTQVSLPQVHFNMNLVRRLSVVSSIMLVALYLYVRFAVIWE